EAARCVGEIGLEQALELQERLVVEGDVVDVLKLDVGLVEAVLHGVLREARIVLLAREALLLRGADEMAVLDQRGGAVMIESRYAEHAHEGVRSLPRTACRRTARWPNPWSPRSGRRRSPS